MAVCPLYATGLLGNALVLPICRIYHYLWCCITASNCRALSPFASRLSDACRLEALHMNVLFCSDPVGMESLLSDVTGYCGYLPDGIVMLPKDQVILGLGSPLTTHCTNILPPSGVSLKSRIFALAGIKTNCINVLWCIVPERREICSCIPKLNRKTLIVDKLLEKCVL